MILDLKGKKVVVIRRRDAVAGTVDKAVARKGADVVIWLRKWNHDGSEAKVLPITQLEVPPQQANGDLYMHHFGARQWGDTNPTGSSGDATPAFTRLITV